MSSRLISTSPYICSIKGTPGETLGLPVPSHSFTAREGEKKGSMSTSSSTSFTGECAEFYQHFALFPPA